VFSEQNKTLGSIDELNAQLTGRVGFFPEACKDFTTYFLAIFPNNAFVLLLVILFSFVYGAGSLFMISWNASVLGAKIGQTALGLFDSYAGHGLLQAPLAYAHGLFDSLGLLPHGIFELPGFFVGAIKEARRSNYS